MARKKKNVLISDKGEAKKVRLPPDGVMTCRKCEHGWLIQYSMSNIKDPMIAKCFVKQFDNYEVADHPRHCSYFNYDDKWQEKRVERRVASTGWHGTCSVND